MVIIITKLTVLCACPGVTHSKHVTLQMHKTLNSLTERHTFD